MHFLIYKKFNLIPSVLTFIVLKRISLIIYIQYLKKAITYRGL